MALRVAAFYKFVHLPDFAARQVPLLDCCTAQKVKGTILLAAEGINGTIAGSETAIAAVLAFLRSDSQLADLEVKDSQAEAMPFDRLKVRLKREIVSLGLPEINPVQQVGTYVSPQEWNAIVADPEVTVIDTRNEFEVSMGTFQGAQNPHTHSFHEFPEYARQHLDPQRDRKVALFCTGGIRCEKASAFLLAEGFSEVYHLKGGILKYLEDVPAEDSVWQGECFVFDRRVAVGLGIVPGTYTLCQCGRPIGQSEICPSCSPPPTVER